MTTSNKALCAGILAALWGTSALAAPPPVEAFGMLPAIADVHLSPDGTHFSTLEPVNGKPAVVVFQIHPGPGAKPLIYSLPESNATGSYWVNNDRLVCFFYQTKFYGGSSQANLSQLTAKVSVSISGKTPPFKLMEGSHTYDYNVGSNLAIDGRSDGDPAVVFMEAPKLYGQKFKMTLFAVNSDNNHTDTLESGNKDTTGFFVDGSGHAVARIDATADYKDTLDRFFLSDGGNWRQIAAYDNSSGSLATMAGPTLDGSAIVIVQRGDGDKRFLQAVPFKTGTPTSTLYSNPDYDAGALMDEWTDRVVGAVYVDDKPQVVYFDPELAHIQKRLEKALPGQTVTLSTWDKTRASFLITAEDPHNPPGIYLFTPANGHLEYLMNAYPSLQASDLGDMKAYSYKARDGLDIHAYLTLPPGKDPHNLPAVVFPHGGPDARDQIGFDWWAQFMASRGYVVLQPNFRGSTGYGVKFRNAGFGEWGRKMQDDVTDGVKKMIADGIADPKRICIVGASYGGYAALAGATFTPDLYACAVSYAGIADVSSILGQARHEGGSDSTAMKYWETRVGVSYADTPLLRAISPAFHADQVRAPVLLLHSTNDLTVPATESLREKNALVDAGKKVRYVELPGDDHYLQHDDARLALLREIDAFLAANIGH